MNVLYDNDIIDYNNYWLLLSFAWSSLLLALDAFINGWTRVSKAIWPSPVPNRLVGWMLELYTLATPEVISGWALTSDSAQSWWLYSAALLGDHADGTPWPDIPLSPYPILIMLSAWPGSDKEHSISHWYDSTRVRTHDFVTKEMLPTSWWNISSIEECK